MRRGAEKPAVSPLPPAFHFDFDFIFLLIIYRPDGGHDDDCIDNGADNDHIDDGATGGEVTSRNGVARCALAFFYSFFFLFINTTHTDHVAAHHAPTMLKRPSPTTAHEHPTPCTHLCPTQ